MATDEVCWGCAPQINALQICHSFYKTITIIWCDFKSCHTLLQFIHTVTAHKGCVSPQTVQTGIVRSAHF